MSKRTIGSVKDTQIAKFRRQTKPMFTSYVDIAFNVVEFTWGVLFKAKIEPKVHASPSSSATTLLKISGAWN